MEDFPSKLRRMRERQRLDRKTLGELCGLSKNQIARFERGERSPRMEDLIAIADFFECDMNWLCGRNF